MVRSAAAVLALLVAFALGPGRAEAQNQRPQQAPGVHEVVRGNTLWDLAQHFYGDPWQWPRIWDANRDRVQNPHLILPGQVLRIPDLATGEIREVQVVGGEPQGQPQEPAPARGARPVPYRTVFWPAVASRRSARDAMEGVPAVPRDQFFSARWLVPLEGEVDRLGRVVGFSGAEEIRGTRQTLMPFDEVRVEFPGGVPPVGTRLQAFRVEGPFQELGRVAVPTGVVEVTQVQPAGAVVVVRDAYERMQPGDFVRMLPRFTLVPGEAAQPVDDGPEATVLGFASPSNIKGIGEQLFLDRGAREGIRVGDVFQLIWDGGEGWGPEVEGSLQVIGVQDEVATARVTAVTNPVFSRGVRVRLSRRLPLTQ